MAWFNRGGKMTEEHTPEEIKYRLSDLGVQIGNIAIEYISELEKELADAKKVQVVEHFEAYGQCRDSRRIAKLEAQIEKMKCIENCATYEEWKCPLQEHPSDKYRPKTCQDCTKWKLKE